MTASGYIAEVFSGIQGEGLWVGERQILVRLAGCNLRCAYCDTAWARERTLYCRAEKTPGERDFEEHANPLDAACAAQLILRLHEPPGLHSAISFTGGEPLLQPELLRDLAQRARAAGLKVHLETNGTLPDALAQVLAAVDVIAMDVKLPSVAGIECWDEHRAFVQAARPLLARRDAALFLKAVFAEDTSDDEVEQVCRLVASVSRDIPLILQPVTRVADGPEPPSPERTLCLQAVAARFLPHVRVIPQTHRIMGQL